MTNNELNRHLFALNNKGLDTKGILPFLKEPNKENSFDNAGEHPRRPLDKDVLPGREDNARLIPHGNSHCQIDHHLLRAHRPAHLPGDGHLEVRRALQHTQADHGKLSVTACWGCWRRQEEAPAATRGAGT